MNTEDQQEKMIAQGVAAEQLLQSDIFNSTINNLVEASFQTFTSTNSNDVDERERCYHHYRALVDIVQTLQQRVSIKDEIISKSEDDNNQEEE